jgi:hypothetical protein
MERSVELAPQILHPAVRQTWGPDRFIYLIINDNTGFGHVLQVWPDFRIIGGCYDELSEKYAEFEK